MSKDQQIQSLTNALSLMGTANENVREAKGIINNVIRSLKSERVIEEELKRAQSLYPKGIFTGS